MCTYIHRKELNLRKKASINGNLKSKKGNKKAKMRGRGWVGGGGGV
jgi:hypothetical protein